MGAAAVQGRLAGSRRGPQPARRNIPLWDVGYLSIGSWLVAFPLPAGRVQQGDGWPIPVLATDRSCKEPPTLRLHRSCINLPQ